MFYKHWKKLALTLTGLFWASCDFGISNSSNEECLYGSPSDIYQPPDTPESNNQSSSSEEASSSSSAEESSSSRTVQQSSSSNDFETATPLYGVRLRDYSSSSNEGEIVAPAYGVYNQVACYNALADKKTLKREQDNETAILQCEDGVTCQEKITDNWAPEYECIDEICPDYGVVRISEKIYTCDDGKIYNEAEFLSRYNKKSGAKPESSSSNNKEVNSSDSQFDGPIAVYGTPCYFDGTCRDDK